jgi:ATP phosphoribosyltransferase
VDKNQTVTVAIPKGRILKPLSLILSRAGVDPDVLLSSNRKLIRKDPATGIRFLLLKPDDVPTYVEYGAADLGIVGRDLLLERSYSLYTPLDLGIGRCRMAIAAPKGYRPRSGILRVATKFQHTALRYFGQKGQPVEIISVQGSVELAPLTGLSDVIVDLVETGETLSANGLEVIETILEISTVVVANRVGLKLKQSLIHPILEALA